MDPIQNILSQCKFMVLEGGQATELERLGCDLNHKLWSARLLIEDPELIKTVYERYLDAGADCITTNTYQATYPGFASLGLSPNEIDNIFALSVRIACESREACWDKIQKEGNVRRPKPLVAASIGSYGAYLSDGSEYRGEYDISDDELYDFHYQRIKTFIEVSDKANGIDLFAFETIPDFTESKTLVKILEGFPESYAWLSFSIRDENHISGGESLREVASYFEGHAQLSAIGVNCTQPSFVEPAIKAIKNNCSLPVIVYPNSGECFDAQKKIWGGKPEDIGDFYRLAELWYSCGAEIIGGCCRTIPDDIRAIARFRADLQESDEKPL